MIFAKCQSSELTSATAAVDLDYRYVYNFDDIGNRRSSLERRVQSAEYEANSLNQYTAIDDFTPQYDADGNQTLVKTATGIWNVTYNGENRPVRWELVSSNSNTPNSNTQNVQEVDGITPCKTLQNRHFADNESAAPCHQP